MKKIMLLFLFITPVIAALSVFAKSVPVLRFTDRNKGYCGFATTKHNTYCVTRHVLYKVAKSGLLHIITLPADCNEATADNDTLLLATSNGIKAFEEASGKLRDVLPKEITGNISHIKKDERGTVWFTKEFEGCFTLNRNHTVEKIVNVPVTYSLAYTPDSIIWVGTNVGLYKVLTSGERIERYAEEGVADKDLPDNLVEHIYPAKHKGIWAVMPGHISFIMPDEDEEGADLENIGGRDNELYDIEEAPGLLQSFLFITSQGILYMPKQNNNDVFRIGEIHQNIKETAYQLKDDLINKPNEFKGETVTKIEVTKQTVYFITDNGFWTMSTSRLTQAIHKKYGKA